MQVRLRTGAAAAALSALLCSLLGPASPATAAVTPHALRCVTTTSFGVDFVSAPETYDVRLNTPTSVDNGATVALRLEFDQLPVTPVELSGVVATTTASLRLELPSQAPEVLTEVGDASEVTDVDAFGRLPGQREFAWNHEVIAATPGDALVIHIEELTVDYVSTDPGMASVSVTCTPVSTDPLDSVTVLGDPPLCYPGCLGEQVFVGDPPASALSLDLDPDDELGQNIVLPQVTSTTEAQELGITDLMFARVSDRRSVPLGWTLTATLDGPLTHTSGTTLPSSAVRLHGVDCGQTAGAAGSSPSVPGDSGTLDTAVDLCSVGVGSVGNTGAAGGQWDVTGDLTLSVPAFAPAGEYSGTILLMLS